MDEPDVMPIQEQKKIQGLKRSSPYPTRQKDPATNKGMPCCDIPLSSSSKSDEAESEN
jgi:hypothetical protein